MVEELVDRGVPLKYPQYELNTCAFMSMASALHYCASTLQMGDKQIGALLAAGAEGYVRGKNARAQLNLLSKLVIQRSTYFNQYQLRAKQKKMDFWDLPNSRNPWPTVVVLKAGDGSTDHSVVIVNGLVFDSNTGSAMKLSKATLDWCCSCVGGYVGAQYALRFWHA